VKRAIFAIVILITTIMTACVSTTTPTPIASVTPFITKTALFTPTNTVSPTKTRTRNPTATNTTIPTITHSTTPTPNATFTPVATRDRASQILQSPDGQLVAKLYDLYNYPTGVDTIEIQDLKSSVVMVIPFQGKILREDGSVFWDIPSPGEMWQIDPHPNLRILEWSKDSQDLYFYYALSVDGGPSLWDGYDLQQVHIETGDISKTLPGNGAMAFSFSPSQEYLIYSRAQDKPARIFVRNVLTGVERSIKLISEKSDYQVGGFHWSPYNDKELLFYTLDGEWFQVYFLNIETKSQAMLIEFFSEDYWFDSWLSSGRIRYTTYPEKEITEIDVRTLEKVVIGTATPTPEP
jgi:hypothetical protein